jgi:hypothetical protein
MLRTRSDHFEVRNNRDTRSGQAVRLRRFVLGPDGTAVEVVHQDR